MTMLQDAISELGVVEGKGSANDPRVLEYEKITGYSQDSVPWCGSFMAWLAKKNGIPFTASKAAAALYWATDWIEEGYGVKLKAPIPGAIMVKKRVGGNHVTMFHRWIDKNAGVFEGVGGNQGGGKKSGHDGAVTLSRFLISDFFSIAWPKKVPIPSANKPLRKSESILGGSVIGGTGVVTAVQVAPTLQKSIETLTQPPKETVQEVVQDAGGSLTTAIQQSETARATGTVLGAVLAVVIIGAAVWIIISRINNARKDRSLQE